MRTLFIFIAFCFFLLAGKAQKYGNEWINYSQQYFKIPITKEGLYRLDSVTLSGYYNLNTTNPQNFQLFIKGKEQFLYIHGEADGILNSGDYIEFYANKFMGEVDSLVYTDIKYTPNPYIPMYNDTLYAFLTTNTSLSNKRYVPETDTAFALYPQTDYVYTEKVFTLKNTYNPVEEFASGISDAHLTQAEGFGQLVTLGSSFSFPVPALHPYTVSPLPFYITVNYSGQSKSANYSPDHQIQLFYSNQNNANVLLSDTSFYGYVPVRKKFTINAQNTNNSTAITFSSVVAPSFTNANRTNLHYVHYFYPHTTDLNSQSFFKLCVENHTVSAKRFFEFSNFYSDNSPVILLDISNGRRITTVTNGAQVKAVIPNGSGKAWCIMSAEKDTIAIKKLERVNQSGFFTNYKAVSAVNPYVIIYHKNLEASALAYRNYRQSAGGGNYNVIAADIETLYEQFSFGIKKHPVSIRHFLKFLHDSLAQRPKYVLIIGKGISFTHSTYHPQNLVPTIGVPGSDNLLSAALSPTATNGYFPEIPIGRLAVMSNAEVTTYLTKVQKHEETAELADWRKQVLHFVGGDSEGLLNTLSGYMSTYEEIIRDTLFGGKVTTVKKNTTEPVQNNISDSLRGVINRGAGLINFFGHGSTQGFDQAIDDPDMYNNKDKYPFIIANSCYSGDIHILNQRSVSERFILANQKGSIGFVASTSNGFPWNLNNFTTGFYKALSQSHYNMGVGDFIKSAALNTSNGDVLDKLVGIDMTLSGDPAVKISNGLLPDYIIGPSDVSFDLKKYTDSVGVKIRYKNLGMARNDTFAISIERYLPNGDSMTIIKYVRPVMYQDSFSYYFPLDFDRGIGLNKFNIMLDYYQRIPEVSEINNKLGPVDLFIPGGDILPVYPYKYAVVPKTPTLTLKASTTNPFAPLTTYRLQLDTSDKFTSIISTTLITSTGGVLEWKVNLPYSDSTVYFWRVSRDSLSPQKAFVWRESSFQTIGDKHGWSQAHFHQFKNNTYRYVNYQYEQRRFIFQNNKHSVQCRTGIHPYLNLSLMNYFFDTEKIEAWSSSFNGWNFAVFDSISGHPQQVFSPNYPQTGFGTYNNCIENGMRFVYSFGAINACGATPDWKTDMESFLSAIPSNHYVLGYTTGLTEPGYSQTSSYSNSLYNAFESIGAKDIRTTPDTVAYVLFGKKGMSAGEANVMIGENKTSILFLEDSIKTRWKTGYIASEVIGPSYNWNSLHWRVKNSDQTAGDTSVLKLVGIRSNGQTDTLAAFIQDSANVNLSNYVNAGVHPYLRLVAFMHDNVHRTAPQLKSWQVLYDEAPECALNPLKGFSSINDTLQEGDVVTFKFPIENIGTRDFTDSLVITYWIEDKNLLKHPLPHKLKTPPFKAGEIIVDTVRINSYQFTGSNGLWIFVNPQNNPRYQHEQSQFNNIGRFPFKVNTDVTNPLLDVTFDGVRILNGDIVSAKPNILITLKDENKFLALNDTSSFTIYLTPPHQSRQRIFFGERLHFTPANLPKNSCSVNYTPDFDVDGTYLLSVQARDRSHNASGAREYQIQFEINNHPSITQVLNYPNPFSTSTRFVFTLTGSEVPEVFTIQIMTITGKVVREITRAELGNIRIGRNITEYAWDGRDNFGDRLGNGVYLYRVITKLNGVNVDRNNSAADKYFTKDFGKMVLIR